MALIRALRALELDDVGLVAGALLIAIGLWMLAPWLGVAIAGVLLIAGALFLGGDS